MIQFVPSSSYTQDTAYRMLLNNVYLASELCLALLSAAHYVIYFVFNT